MTDHYLTLHGDAWRHATAAHQTAAATAGRENWKSAEPSCRYLYVCSVIICCRIPHISLMQIPSVCHILSTGLFCPAIHRPKLLLLPLGGRRTVPRGTSGSQHPAGTRRPAGRRWQQQRQRLSANCATVCLPARDVTTTSYRQKLVTVHCGRLRRSPLGAVLLKLPPTDRLNNAIRTFRSIYSLEARCHSNEIRQNNEELHGDEPRKMVDNERRDRSQFCVRCRMRFYRVGLGQVSAENYCSWMAYGQWNVITYRKLKANSSWNDDNHKLLKEFNGQYLPTLYTRGART